MHLDRFLRPKHIAVLGGVWADTVVEQAERLGFEGPIWRVHPKRGLFRSLADLPQAPDAIFMGVNAQGTIDLVREAREMGAGGVVGFASGFGELGTEAARQLEAELANAAGDMPVLGPNCYGMINFFDQVSLFPDQVRQERPERGVAVITQSGTVALNVMYSERSLPLGYLLASGNAQLLTLPMLVNAMASDARVSAIGLYIEDIPDLASFCEAVDCAHKAGKRVVVFKAGRSEASARITASHTGALGGTDRYYDALFKRLGVPRVHTLAEFVETLKVFHGFGGLPDNALFIAAPSGGDVAMAADVIEALPLSLAPFSETMTASLRAELGPQVTLANPFDFQTHTWHDVEALERVFTSYLSGPATTKVLQIDVPSPEHFDPSSFIGPIRAYFRAAQTTGARAALLSSMPESLPEVVRQEAWVAGVVPLQGMAEGYRAVANAALLPGDPPLVRAGLGQAKALTEAEGKKRLVEAGISVPKGRNCPVQAPDTSGLAFPLVVKSSNAELAHKSDAGGVVLNCRSHEDVAQAAQSMAHLGEHVLIEEMAEGGLIELIIGIDNDPRFGPVVLVGAGGIFTELFKDSAVLLPPFDRTQAETALRGLKCAALFDGYRGKPAASLSASVDALMAVQTLTTRVDSLDINPLIVRDTDAIAVDCYMTLLEDSP